MVESGYSSSLLQVVEEKTVMERVLQYLMLCRTMVKPRKGSSVLHSTYRRIIQDMKKKKKRLDDPNLSYQCNNQATFWPACDHSRSLPSPPMTLKTVDSGVGTSPVTTGAGAHSLTFFSRLFALWWRRVSGRREVSPQNKGPVSDGRRQ